VKSNANLEDIMSNARSSFLIGTMIVVGMGLAMPAAHAFNPQPDPPAKSRLNTNTKTYVGDKNVVAPGLLDTRSGFSTNGVSATGTPLGGGAAGGARPGGAGIK
jgi:hypothetical protein